MPCYAYLYILALHNISQILRLFIGHFHATIFRHYHVYEYDAASPYTLDVRTTQLNQRFFITLPIILY